MSSTLTALIRAAILQNIHVRKKKKKPNAIETERARERRYFEVYPGCLALANALFSEVEWHISSH